MQQKLVLARELGQSPKVLLVGQPTRGVDIGAIEFIYTQLRAMRDAGCAVLVVSSELDEILALADRVIVMTPRPGRIRADIAVPLPRPRTHAALIADPHATALRATVLAALAGRESGTM